MSDDQPRSFFPGLKPTPEPTPSEPVAAPATTPPTQPQFQIGILELNNELAYLTQVMMASTPETIEDATETVNGRIEPLFGASTAAITERVTEVERAYGPLMGEMFAAMMMRMEIQRFVIQYILDPVSLSPACHAAREQEEANEEDDNS